MQINDVLGDCMNEVHVKVYANEKLGVKIKSLRCNRYTKT